MRNDDSKYRQTLQFIRKNLLPRVARGVSGDAAVNDGPPLADRTIGLYSLIFSQPEIDVI